jgi:hypothetical protein
MISGQVRFDIDDDGDLSDPDPGIPGVKIELWTDPNGDGNPNDGMMVAMTTTDGSGNYKFNNVAPGTYVVVEIDPAAFDSTGDSVGPNDNRVPVVLPPEGNVTARDFLDFGPENCTDGVDNDFDTDVDCDDSQCEELPICTMPAPAATPFGLVLLIAALLSVAAFGFRRSQRSF